MSIKIRLRTSDGQLIAWANIPHFQKAPDMLAWGIRIFVKATRTDYVEGFCYHIPILAVEVK